MSEHFLKFVSTDPVWQPTKEDAARAVELLKSIAPDADYVEATFYDHIEFHDPGGNWSGVNCAACGADLDGWFFEALEKAYGKNSFDNLYVKTPCCQLKASLNDLDFGAPSAFGRFLLIAKQPGVDPDEAQVKAVEACLGAPVRKIWMRL